MLPDAPAEGGRSAGEGELRWSGDAGIGRIAATGGIGADQM